MHRSINTSTSPHARTRRCREARHGPTTCGNGIKMPMARRELLLFLISLPQTLLLSFLLAILCLLLFTWFAPSAGRECRRSCTCIMKILERIAFLVLLFVEMYMSRFSSSLFSSRVGLKKEQEVVTTFFLLLRTIFLGCRPRPLLFVWCLLSIC